MDDTNFVFLICSERSGSNLMSTILRCHSRVAAPPPYHLCRDIGMNLHATLGEGTASPAWRVMQRSLVARVERLDSREAAERLERWLGTIDEISFCDIARFVFCELDGAGAPQTVFVKENNIHQMLFFILRCFPDAKFVFQVRDPRDYLVSARARRRRWLGNKFGSDRRALEIWHEDQLGGLRAMAHLGPDRVFFQRYEDLISQPEAVLSALCTFMGLEFEPGMLEFHRSEHAARQAGAGGQWENLSDPLMAGNSGKYRQGLTKRRITMVETYVGDLMERFGYQRDFPHTQAPGLLRVFWPQVSEPLERFVNGEWRPFSPVGISADVAPLAGAITPRYASTSDGSGSDAP